MKKFIKELICKYIFRKHVPKKWRNQFSEGIICKRCGKVLYYKVGLL